MVPDLGWQPSYLVERLPIIRQELSDYCSQNYFLKLDCALLESVLLTTIQGSIASGFGLDPSVIGYLEEGLLQIYQIAQQELRVPTTVSSSFK